MGRGRRQRRLDVPLDAARSYGIPRWRGQKAGAAIPASDPRPPLAPLASITVQEAQEFWSRHQVRRTTILSGTLNRNGDTSPLSSPPVTLPPQSTHISTLDGVMSADAGPEEEPTTPPQRQTTPAQSQTTSPTLPGTKLSLPSAVYRRALPITPALSESSLNLCSSSPPIPATPQDTLPRNPLNNNDNNSHTSRPSSPLDHNPLSSPRSGSTVRAPPFGGTINTATDKSRALPSIPQDLQTLPHFVDPNAPFGIIGGPVPGRPRFYNNCTICEPAGTLFASWREWHDPGFLCTECRKVL